MPNSNDTGWRPIAITGGDGDTSAKGKIDLATTAETRPCYACKNWDDDRPKLMRHFASRGMYPDPHDGLIRTPIMKDFPERQSMTINPKTFGFCLRDSIPTDDEATCENWQPTKSIEDLRRRLRR